MLLHLAAALASSLISVNVYFVPRDLVICLQKVKQQDRRGININNSKPASKLYKINLRATLP